MILKCILKCIGIYICISIIINPLTSSFYIMSIGNSMGLQLLDERGYIKNKKTQKLLNDNATSIKFIRDLRDASVFYWLFLHPLSTPYSCYYTITSTFNAINYLLYDKTRVEMGEFDK